MKPYYLFLVVVVCLGSALLLPAQEAPKGPATGKVLLLRNGSVMEGDIRQTGTQVFVRDGTSEIGVSMQLVLRICSDWNDAYAFVLTLVKEGNVDDHVDLARWCQRHGLNDKSLEHARKALAIQPTHPGAKQIVTILESALPDARKEPATPSVQLSPPPHATETIPSVDVISETLVGFTTRVQPILMNACANCHCTERGGNFHLERVQAGSQKNATQKNLAKILTYIDFEHPAISPLLVKAVMRHGKAQQAPIKDREAQAFLSIQEWIAQTIARNPHLKEYQAAQIPKAPLGPETHFASSKVMPGTGRAPLAKPAQRLYVEPKPPMPPPASVPGKDNPPGLLPASVTQTPAAVPMEDPYGPEIFNRAYHPQR